MDYQPTTQPTCRLAGEVESSAQPRQRDAEALVRGIAWLSIAIGAAELLAPRRTRRAVSVGIAGWWMRLRGLRTVIGGVALLVVDDKTRWLHRRSVANALDVVTLLNHHGGRAGARARNATAIAAIGGLTAVEMTAAELVKDSAAVPRAAKRSNLRDGSAKVSSSLTAQGSTPAQRS